MSTVIAHPSPIDQVASLSRQVDNLQRTNTDLNIKLSVISVEAGLLREREDGLLRQRDELHETTNRYLERARRAEREAKGRAWHINECQQIAGKVLGYPWYKDSPEIFPGATEADGVCVGDHVADTIVEELARAYTALRFGDLDMSWTGRVESLRSWVRICHGASVAAGWYTDLETGQRKQRNVPEMLCLIHSEISEAMEGYRKNLQDDKIPSRKMIEVELADAFIRIADLCGYLGLDLGGAVVEKMDFNKVRTDHQIENRKIAGGKAF